MNVFSDEDLKKLKQTTEVFDYLKNIDLALGVWRKSKEPR
jgi:hypothetical protein